MILPPPTPTLFPYTTLFRSRGPPTSQRFRTMGKIIAQTRSEREEKKPRPTWGESLSRAFTTTDRKSTRLNSSHPSISYAVFCLKKKKKKIDISDLVQQRTQT